MPSQPTYFPILRAKRGEIQALGALSPEARRRVRPIIEIPRQKENDSRSLSTYLCEIIRALPSTWGTKSPVYIDMPLFPADSRIEDDIHPVKLLFDVAHQSGLQMIPTTGTLTTRGPESDYLICVSEIAHQYDSGIALRFEHSDIFDTERLKEKVESTRKLVGIDASKCDVFLDLEAMDRLPTGSHDYDTLLTVIRSALNRLADVRYRQVILCGSSIPEFVGKMYDREPCRVERTELRLWKKLLADKRVQNLGFGDYGIIYPFQSNDGAPVRPPSRIRLSTPTEHVLYRSIPDGYQQLRARVTKESPANFQVDSIGKRAIFGLGHGFSGVGNATDWVTRDMNAHIESTVSHITHERRRRRIPRRADDHVSASVPWLQEGLELPPTDHVERR